MPTKKRDPLLTTKGTRYTYAGWVRAYNAADFPGKMALGREYPGYANRRVHEMDKKSHRKPEADVRAANEEKAERARFRKMPIAELRREYYGTLKESMGGPFAPTAKRAHALIEAEMKRRGSSAQPKERKPATRKSAPAKPLKPNQYRTVGGKVRTVPAKKPTTRKAEYTPKQRALMREIFRYEREIEKATDRLLSHRTIDKASGSPEDRKLRDLREKQRKAELELYRLNKPAAENVQTRLLERNNKYHNKRMRDTKKKEAFQKGKYTAGNWIP